MWSHFQRTCNDVINFISTVHVRRMLQIGPDGYITSSFIWLDDCWISGCRDVLFKKKVATLPVLHSVSGCALPMHKRIGFWMLHSSRLIKHISWYLFRGGQCTMDHATEYCQSDKFPFWASLILGYFFFDWHNIQIFCEQNPLDLFILFLGSFLRLYKKHPIFEFWALFPTLNIWISLQNYGRSGYANQTLYYKNYKLVVLGIFLMKYLFTINENVYFYYTITDKNVEEMIFS